MSEKTLEGFRDAVLNFDYDQATPLREASALPSTGLR